LFENNSIKYISSTSRQRSMHSRYIWKLLKFALKTLRKRTGYSYVNCRKALLEFGANRLEDAEKWLHNLAVKEGWMKATKLSDRKAINGLISIAIEDNKAVLVEVNCETDFVARSEIFKSLESFVLPERLLPIKIELDKLYSENKKMTINDLLANTVGKIGENIVLKKVYGIVADPDIMLSGYTHPKEGTKEVNMGRFASIVGLRRFAPGDFPLKTIGEQICQHIVGMKYVYLFSLHFFRREKQEASQASHLEEIDTTTQLDEKETSLLRQSFMLCPSQSVYEYVNSHGAKIIDFVRAELGEE
uniref:Elongation factor Ts, mitochondrial n=1 Tax=Dracunculus medinensis TaxID=318479 RepID=A0A0N4UJE6_DRAME